ncbi:hypothetical protein [Ancylobacter polymorphus]|uniref:Uncharacterized protein n=2 Tax=Ancylobacter TaxID=99 RepID=A0A9E7A6C9_9HYPH|nr:hypothetical protein [Ancylobacter polymorphus]PZQ83493.1 MAG: hypothetical protein DI549_07760 [Ancylobacter novellus]UOK73708.1 hypothetical protein K9D25_23885 [Ancylobacter polymorphus]
MSERWDMNLSEPVSFHKDGEARTLRTLDDARGLLSAHEPSEGDRELCQAAVTTVTKAASSGQPSDREMATEQMRILLRSLGWI